MKIHFLIILAGSLSVAVRSSGKPVLGYESIFNFGDSLSDTGNFLVSGDKAFPVIGRLPYGQTFFKRPTGRCSDGRLIIDFMAEASGLPYLPPYLQRVRTKSSTDFRKGINFAVAGATALSSNFFLERKLGTALWTNSSLDVQLAWFKKSKPSLCMTKQDCEEYFKRSLFFVGEIGGNDYNYPLLLSGSIEQAMGLVPLVVGTIINATTTLIEESAMTVVVPGNLPIGCSATFLTRFQRADQSQYDGKNQCLKVLNNLAKFHNNQLKQSLEVLRKKYSHAKIIYADYYTPAMQFYNAPLRYGFKEGVLKACCGGGGPYNFNNMARCGHQGSTACKDPSLYANWDGIHLTEAAYRHIASVLISSTFNITNSL